MARRDNRRGDSQESDELQLRAVGLVDELLAMTAPSDPKYQYLLLLRHQLETDERQMRDAQEVLEQFEEAYAKLTETASKIGMYLGPLENSKKVFLAVGDGEYVGNVDPKLDAQDMTIGDRVILNDAFAVVQVLPPHVAGPLVKVGEVLDDTRLRVGGDVQGLNSRIVGRGEALLFAELKPGDEVRMDPTGKLAMEHFPKTESKDFFLEEVPQVPWDKVGGQDEVIEIIRDAIEKPLLYPELYERFGKRPLKGILLYGPPGCGKTLIGKATAYNLTKEYNQQTGQNLKEYFMYINGPKILNMWLGESERQVREIFATAREKAKEGHLVFIFIDEAESILRTRNSGRWTNISNTVVPQFCAEMDGLVSSANVVVMLTSNRPDYIDPAILRPERIDRRVRVKRPDRKAAKDILSIYLNENVPIDCALIEKHNGDKRAAAAELVDNTVAHLWRKDAETEFLDVFNRNGGTERLYWKDLVSGALLSSLVERAKDFAIKRAIASGNHTEGLTQEDLYKALALEFKENEIFPKSDAVEDWLMLLDQAPENVADVKPIRQDTRGKGTAKKPSGVI
ncbi:AAA family ATPase [Armatimonas rosea]|uniref:Proteasome-associated ATPase n=1 Tax=Armatimonas rosea TaxID=685828 RepID=A0A7W9W638_ARMRO|nr:AAA family ATPase [Armatimonas rosea]MBB6049605.1 proteasome-associated ATPase [Armatimonas rosea]